MPAVSTMTAVHEQVHDRAEQNQRIRQQAEDMSCVLGDEVEGCECEKDDQSQASGQSQKGADAAGGQRVLMVHCVLHRCALHIRFVSTVMIVDAAESHLSPH